MKAFAILACLHLAAIDGDSLRCDGRDLRLLGDGVPFVSGVDAPELSHARCPAERALARAARARLAELAALPGGSIEDSGVRDVFRRPLVRLRLADGRTAGALLLAEGLARPWRPGHRNDWC